MWLRVVAIRNSHYNLPNGSIGRDLVGLLSSEVNLLVQGSMSSERVIVFLTVILQRDPMVKRGADVRRLLLRRLEDWKVEKFTDLVFDAERCSRQHSKPRRKDGEDHTVAVFTRLMLRGQVCSAVRFITDRVSGGGVLACDSPSGIPGKSVADVLREKHPEPCSFGRDAFLPCDSLPPVLDVDIRLIMWRGLLIVFKGLLAWVDQLLCSGTVTFCDLVHTVLVCVMLWLGWLAV